LLAVPASFSPDCGRLVGEPETWKDIRLYCIERISAGGIFKL
jgi:hypothetical protein